MNNVLEAIFGNRSVTYILLFLQQHGEGHASLIARTFGVSPTGIQRQLKRLEENAVLTSRLVGRNRVFTLNDAEPTVASLRRFLAAELNRSAAEPNASISLRRETDRISSVNQGDKVVTDFYDS